MMCPMTAPDGPIVKRRKIEKSETSAPTRFESFTRRVARLKIDPVRQTGGFAGNHATSSQADFSYFRSSLDSWADQNLSEDFSHFLQDVQPISDSLAQLFHHESEIFKLLLQYLQSSRPVALEPLLDLVSHFAHDLGMRFERFFERTVTLVGGLASTHHDIQVIEWSFNCLTWLFKYLSKLLVPDLRPLYNILSPLLGKKRQKPFVIRFAAEALSFLVRRSALSYQKNRTPVTTIVKHVLDDLNSQSQASELYMEGISILFSESIKGANATLSSNGDKIFEEVASYALHSLDDATESSSDAIRVLHGVIVEIFSRCDADNLYPLVKAVLRHTCPDNLSTSDLRTKECMNLVLIIMGIKNGSKIAAWADLLKHLQRWRSFLESSKKSSRGSIRIFLTTVAFCHATSPTDAALAHLALTTGLPACWPHEFLDFGDLYARINPQRFGRMIYSEVRRFICSYWKDHTKNISMLLPGLVDRGQQSLKPDDLPLDYWNHIEASFKTIFSTPTEGIVEDDPTRINAVCYANQLLEILKRANPQPAVSNEVQIMISASLLNVLRDLDHEQPRAIHAFALGNAFQFAFAEQMQISTPKLRSSLCRASSKFTQSPIFWRTLLSFLSTDLKNLDFTDEDAHALKKSLLDGLQSPLPEVRELCLEVVQTVVARRKGLIPQALESAISIARLDPSIHTIRSILMHLRNLSSGYGDVAQDEWLGQMIPAFCFGLLHLQLTPVWDDVYSALKVMSSHVAGERLICDTVFQWLEILPTISDTRDCEQELKDADEPDHCMPGLAGPELTKILSLARQTTLKQQLPDNVLQQKFWEQHAFHASSKVSHHEQVLKILKANPTLAEKNSRRLVPILLIWANNNESSESTEQKELGVVAKWTRTDLKTLLSIFSLFTNPKCLFQSAQVYSTLLILLSHGDREIQKAALNAVFAWKQPHIIRYQEQLTRCLAEANFAEQLNAFVLDDRDEGSLQKEHWSEVMPILSRLAFGALLRERGAERRATRRRIFLLLSRFPEEYVSHFLGIILDPLESFDLNSAKDDQLGSYNESIPIQRKQYGLLNVIFDMLDILNNTAAPYCARLAGPVLACLLRAHDQEDSSDDFQARFESNLSSLTKSIRHVGLRCLNKLFQIKSNFDWDPYMPVLFRKVVDPRVPNLPAETGQGVSALLKLFSIWAASENGPNYLIEFNSDLLPKLAGCIGFQAGKEEVKRFVLSNIFIPLLEQADLENQRKSGNCLLSSLRDLGPLLVQEIDVGLRSDNSKEFIQMAIDAIVKLSKVATLSSSRLLEACSSLLKQPSRRIAWQSRIELLRILQRAIPHTEVDDQLFNVIYGTVCGFFTSFTSRDSRSLLCNILFEMAVKQEDLQVPAQLSIDLNSFSEVRLDEPDFERRSQAFTSISEDQKFQLSPRQWMPLVANLLYFVKDTEELTIRTSASNCLRQFSDAAMDSPAKEKQEYTRILQDFLWKTVKAGLKTEPDIVLAEYVAVLAHIARTLDFWIIARNLRPLIEDDDFSILDNIMHIQQNKRIQAIQQLQEKTSKGCIASCNVSELLIPLMEYFAFRSGNETLCSKAIQAIGVLARWLDWTKYRQHVRRYTNLVQANEGKDTAIKVLAAMSQALHSLEATQLSQETRLFETATFLSRTIPNRMDMIENMNRDILPPIIRIVRDKDQSVVSRRAHIAVIATRFLRLMGEDGHSALQAILSDICNILRSEDPVSRDLTRKALSEICSIIGPTSIGFVVKQLRTALQRGFHLHVLSFTVHSILESASNLLRTGDLDYCCIEVLEIIMDDIFGTAGQEKEIADYQKGKDKKKEVKGKKSFDSMRILACGISISLLRDIIRHLAHFLAEKAGHRTIQNADELFRRLEAGVLLNSGLENQELLKFCHDIVQNSEQSILLTQAPNSKPGNSTPRQRMRSIGQTKTNGRSGRGSKHVVKIQCFALSLMRGVLKRSKTRLGEEDVERILPVLCNALGQNQDDMKMTAFRLFTAIIDIPSEKLEQQLPVFVKSAVDVIGESVATSDEKCQSALKLISAVLKQRKDFDINEEVLAMLLRKVKSDLQSSGHQGVSFSFVRSVIARKVTIPELYALIDGDDGVAAISIMNHDRMTRDLARGVYFQFLVEYPQGKARFSKQISFLVRNLEYEHAEGRESAMETIHLALTKLGDILAQEIMRAAFWPVVSVIINDASKQCRDMASGLAKTMFARGNEFWHQGFLSVLKELLKEDAELIQKRTALQCWTLYLEVKGEEARSEEFVLKAVMQILKDDFLDGEEGWQLTYMALHTVLVLCKLRPKVPFAKNRGPLWVTIRETLLRTQSWLKYEAAKLIGMQISDIAKQNPQLRPLPLYGSGGLELSAQDTRDLARDHLRVLKHGTNQDLGSQLVRNLAFVGRCFSENDILWPRKSDHATSGPEAGAKEQSLTGLDYLFGRLAFILRQNSPNGQASDDTESWTEQSMNARSASLQLLAALCTALPPEKLSSSVDMIALPLVYLTDPTTSGPAAYKSKLKQAHDDLVSNANELLELLQTKMGTTEFVKVVQRVRKNVYEKRDDRRKKRKTEAITLPEVTERVKRRRREKEKSKKKLKSLAGKQRRLGL